MSQTGQLGDLRAGPQTWQRLHPLTPVLRGWKIVAVVFFLVAENGLRRAGPTELAVALAIALPLAAAYGYLSWRFTRYGFTGDDLTVETGVLNRRSRRVALSRLQAVDVVQPLIARALGLAELRLEVAGGGSTEAPLAFLSLADAHRLRAEMLARAAGIDAATPEAPEQVLVRVPLGAVMLSAVLRGPVVIGVAWVAAVIGSATVTGRAELVAVVLPLVFAVVGPVVAWVTTNFDFTLAESPDGLRVRRGLLETRAQTVPPGRVHAVRLSEPWLWRAKGWVRLDANVAGYGSGGDEVGGASTLLPVAPREVALSVLARVLPGVDVTGVPLSPVPPRARWRAPVQWRRLAVGDDASVFVARRGRFLRQLDAVPHARTQSVRVTQGPWQRRLGLASVHVDTAPGPVRVTAAHRDASEARAVCDAQVERARQARLTSGPDRWMAAPSAQSGDRVYGYDPSSPDFVAHPYDAYAALREKAPVCWDERTRQWLVSRYDDVNAALRDRRLGRTYLHLASHEKMGREPDAPETEPFWHVIRNGMLDREPPDHTRLRRLVSQAFTPGTVERLRPTVDALAGSYVSNLLDATSAGSPADLLAYVAEPLPVTVIAEMLGIPEPDRHLLRPWSADICGMYELNPSAEAARKATAAAVEFAGYLRGLARERRERPTGDLISELAHVVDEGDRLTEDELVGTCVLLLNAGHEATVNVSGNGFYALFRNPDQLDRLRTDPSLLPTAVEELLRYDTPLQMFERYVLADGVEIAGQPIPRGDEVALLFGSANRDPARFVQPDTLDVGRRDNPHLSFGAGIHFCLGAPLARVELSAVFGTLLARAPGLRLAAQPVWKPGYIIRGLRALMVER